MIIDVNKPMTIDTHDIKILDLPLKKEWYDMIESGVKKEEYDVRALMGKPYCMHVTEAMNYLDYDEF